jgi:hypothetical protein
MKRSVQQKGAAQASFPVPLDGYFLCREQLANLPWTEPARNPSVDPFCCTVKVNEVHD